MGRLTDFMKRSLSHRLHAWVKGEERAKTILWKTTSRLYSYAPNVGNRLVTFKTQGQFTKPPILIVGCGRSGTTLLASVLSAHPGIYAIPRETRAFSPTGYEPIVNLDAPFEMNKINSYFLVNAVPSSCTRWCEKTPRNVLFIKRILEYFEGRVRIIHVVRDGRDVVLSRHALNPSGYWVDPERWVQDVSAGLAFDDCPELYRVKYEDLVSDFENIIPKLCDFLDEECTDEILNWQQHATLRTNIAWQNGIQKLNTRSVAKWKKPEFKQRVDTFLKTEGTVELLKRLGYEI